MFGLITRKDIATANAKLALGRKANLGLTTPSAHLVRGDSLPFIPYGAFDPTVGGYPASAQVGPMRKDVSLLCCSLCE